MTSVFAFAWRLMFVAVNPPDPASANNRPQSVMNG
jgi:hypothetical protein